MHLWQIYFVSVKLFPLKWNISKNYWANITRLSQIHENDAVYPSNLSWTWPVLLLLTAPSSWLQSFSSNFISFLNKPAVAPLLSLPLSLPFFLFPFFAASNFNHVISRDNQSPSSATEHSSPECINWHPLLCFMTARPRDDRHEGLASFADILAYNETMLKLSWATETVQ